MGRAPLEVITCPVEILVEVRIVGNEVADRPAVTVLNEILLVDHARCVPRHRVIAKAGRPAGDDEGAAMAVERQPPGPQLIEEGAEDGLPPGTEIGRVGLVEVRSGIGEWQTITLIASASSGIVVSIAPSRKIA